jgi:hypothetical protein
MSGLWDDFAKLYNGNPIVQALCIGLFWFGMAFLLVGLLRRIGAHRKVKELNLQVEALKKKLRSPEGSCSDSYWQDKKELYDRLRKMVREGNTNILRAFENELLSRVKQIGIPESVAFSWEETQSWSLFFRHLGAITMSQFFEDLERNGFESVGVGHQDIDKMIDRYISDKVLLYRSLIQDAMAHEFKVQSMRMDEAGKFVAKKRLLTYAEMETLLGKVQPTVDALVKKIYREAITASKRLVPPEDPEGRELTSQPTLFDGS